jgi:hypothetical protein
MKLRVVIAALVVLLALLAFSRRSSGYYNKWMNGNRIGYIPLTGNNQINGCSGCVWGDGKGGGNMDVITCANCGSGKQSKLFAPYCPSRKSLHSDGKNLAC